MNYVCDLTQLIVSYIKHCTEASTLPQFFVLDVILTFGMCCVVMIDDGSTFNKFFIYMCKVENYSIGAYQKSTTKVNQLKCITSS